MKRTALIAAALSIVPLIGSTFSASAEPYGRGYATPYARPYVARPFAPRVVVVPAPRYDSYHRPHWRPRPYWGRGPHYWR